MGEGGLDPNYYLHQMTLAEARDYMRGQDRRHRNSWEQTRIICSYIAGCMSGEVPDFPLPWDDEATNHNAKKKTQEEQEKEWERLTALAAEMTAERKKMKEQNEQTSTL